MEYYDIIIVGAGPAGSTLARALEDSGKRVLIIDKQAFPRDKTCAGWVSPAVMASLDIDPGKYSVGRTLQPIRRFRIGMMGQSAVENDHGDIVSYGIRRCEFDDYLLDRAECEKQLATAVKSINRNNGNWVINDQWQAPLLVGAGGHFCPVARLLGDGPGKHETVVAAKEVEFEMTPEQARACEARGDTPELWFCRDLKGYAWVFRKGSYLNIGLGREDNHRLSDHLEAFVEEMKQSGRIPSDLPGRFKGHAYLLYAHANRPLVDDGVLLIGDAAGLAYTQSGEGIRPAIESALMASKVIKSATDYSALSLQSYGERIAERFGTRATDQEPGFEVPDWLKQPIASTLMRSHWFTRKVVTEKWFLHQEVPPLEVAV
ncbi:NAD(P)/FAD-dependent oxidoreductase [Marinobacter nauticus]|uniref:NAD(P)/FAD-dependent oxidoreductase n=1 Tax=Marinobacter nauticus TaxID=2743 RepID=UPI001C587FEE|nr:NAD(P)/FAD-dependent oxidoreductase [Marinobacter nauticus]MBW3198376.1 NAD(P)/FAD-dependent oxidoreductase [Marinobacter nauticus]MBY6183786.1 NAD(P)/FAD-dependent oxidoreductase [Marinobacter nauticus]